MQSPVALAAVFGPAGYFKLEVTGRHHTARLLPHEGLCFPVLTKTLGASVGIDTTVKVE